MKPDRSILDEEFVWIPAAATDVEQTWRRFGWRPMTDEERRLKMEQSTIATAGEK